MSRCRELLLLTLLIWVLPGGAARAALPIYWTQAAGMAEVSALVKTRDVVGDIVTVEVVSSAATDLPPTLRVAGKLPDGETETWVTLLKRPPIAPGGKPRDDVYTSYVALPVQGVEVVVPPLSTLTEGVPARVPTRFFLEAVESARRAAGGTPPTEAELTGLKECISGAPAPLRPDRVRLVSFCLGALASASAPLRLPELETWLHAEEPALRFHATWALVAFARSSPGKRDPEIQRALMAAIADEAPQVQALATQELLRQGASGLASAVMAEVAFASATEVARFYPIGKPEVRLPPPQVLMVQALGRAEATPESVAVLYALLESRSDSVAFASLRALEALADPKLPQALIAAVGHGPAGLARMSVRALGRLREPSAIPVLVEVLRNTERPLTLREQAALALGQIRGLMCVDALVRTTEDPSLALATTAALALGHIGDGRATPAVAALLRRPDLIDPEQMERVADALALLGGPSAREALMIRLERETRTPVEQMLRVRLEWVERLSRAGDPAGAVRGQLKIEDPASPEALEELRWAVGLVSTYQLVSAAPRLHELVKALLALRTPQRDLTIEVIRTLTRLGEPLTAQEKALLEAEVERLGVNF